MYKDASGRESPAKYESRMESGSEYTDNFLAPRATISPEKRHESMSYDSSSPETKSRFAELSKYKMELIQEEKEGLPELRKVYLKKE